MWAVDASVTQVLQQVLQPNFVVYHCCNTCNTCNTTFKKIYFQEVVGSMCTEEKKSVLQVLQVLQQ